MYEAAIIVWNGISLLIVIFLFDTNDIGAEYNGYCAAFIVVTIIISLIVIMDKLSLLLLQNYWLSFTVMLFMIMIIFICIMHDNFLNKLIYCTILFLVLLFVTSTITMIDYNVAQEYLTISSMYYVEYHAFSIFVLSILYILVWGYNVQAIEQVLYFDLFVMWFVILLQFWFDMNILFKQQNIKSVCVLYLVSTTATFVTNGIKLMYYIVMSKNTITIDQRNG